MIKKDNIFAIGLMFVVSSVKGTDFFSRARKMQETVNGKMLKLEPYTTLMMMEASHSSLVRFTEFLKVAKSNNDCMFSNLGKIDIPHRYGSFTVESIYSPSVIGPLGNTTTMITSTYRGQMDFPFVGSEGFLPFKEGMEIKEELTKILLTL